MNGMLFTPYPLVNRGSGVLFSSSSFLYWLSDMGWLIFWYDFCKYWFWRILVLLQFLQIRSIWWATYLCLELGSDACFAFFSQNLNRAFMPGWIQDLYLCICVFVYLFICVFVYFCEYTELLCRGGTFLSIILCFLQFFAPPTLLELKWVHCQRSVACRIFCFCFSAFSTASICFSLSSPHTHFWYILGSVTTST